MYTVAKITNVGKNRWRWTIDTPGDAPPTELTVWTPGATKEGMWARAQDRCNVLNEIQGYTKPKNKRKNYERYMKLKGV